MALESGSTDTFKAPKTEAGNRVVPIPEHLIPAFESQKGDPFSWVFTQVLAKNKGKHHTESSLHGYWNNFKRHLDIDMGAKVYRNQIIESKVAKDLTPYVLRHTFCTDLQTAGVPLNIAKELMGHEDITVTANIYTHFSEEDFKSRQKRSINTIPMPRMVKIVVKIIFRYSLPPLYYQCFQPVQSSVSDSVCKGSNPLPLP
jgi:integrase